MCNQQIFLQYAECCKQLLSDEAIPMHHDTLQDMADAWLRLAAEEQRIADLVREADALFAASANSDVRVARSREIRARFQ